MLRQVGTPELFVLAVLFALATGYVARNRSRNTAGWAALGFLFGPVPLIVVALLPPARERT
jgi:hypothetical protein